ncbi:MAG: YHYH domain-containing protein [Oscillospiraceae bacterium]|nr:YHYH domain-containing protein [Oscillospiraceae bacterium]
MNKLAYKTLTLIPIVIIIIITSITMSVSAHPGKTDSKGGHHDSSTGEYHYHHGYSAHQHSNGVCPYDFDDKTSHENKQSTQSTKSPPAIFTTSKILTVDIISLVISLPLALLFTKGKLRTTGRIVAVISIYIGAICCICTFPVVKEIANKCFSIANIIILTVFLLGGLLDRLIESNFFFKLFMYLIAGLAICFPLYIVTLV